MREIDWASPFVLWFSASLFAVVIVGKLLGALLLCGPWRERLAIGIAMIPRGEVGLIFAELGCTSGILNNDIYAALIIVIAMTTPCHRFYLRAITVAYVWPSKRALVLLTTCNGQVYLTDEGL